MSFDGYEFNELETRLKMALAELSNGRPIEVLDEWVEVSSQEYRDSLDRQLHPKPQEFRLRASNAGKPLCALQLDAKNQSPDAQRPYNHILRMLIGDATEAVVNLIIKASGANITGQKSQARYEVGETVINGENDIEIDGKVYDIKSASGWAFNNKWQGGWNSVYKHDTFGYVAQLFIYADGNPDRMGGWIVFDKASGEILVVEAQPTEQELTEIREGIAKAEHAIRTDAPFVKLFEAEEETFYKKPTGNLVVPMICTFCDHMKHCYPNAVYETNPTSKAQNPPKKWYAEKPN